MRVCAEFYESIIKYQYLSNELKGNEIDEGFKSYLLGETHVLCDFLSYLLPLEGNIFMRVCG